MPRPEAGQTAWHARTPCTDTGTEPGAPSKPLLADLLTVIITITVLALFPSPDRLVAELERLPVLLTALLQFESHMTVLHFGIRKHDSYAPPVRSKQGLLFHAGFRTYPARWVGA